MVKYILIALISVSIFFGCTAAEFNVGADSIGSDTTDAFNGSKDSSK